MPPKGTSSSEKSTAAWWKLPELQVLLSKVEAVLPMGEYQWQQVAAEYNISRPVGSSERSWESCRNKFKYLKNTKKPTGDPSCPWEVKEAKRIYREIEGKMAVAEIDDASGAIIAEEENGDCADCSDDSASAIEEEDQAKSGPSPVAVSTTSCPSKRQLIPSPTSPTSPSGVLSPQGVPARLGITGNVHAAIASTATQKRMKLDKQIADAALQRADASESRNALLTTLIMQQQQAQQTNQQMQMMMMMIMSKMFGVQMQMPDSQAPIPSSSQTTQNEAQHKE
jgi:hypothetical protein